MAFVQARLPLALETTMFFPPAAGAGVAAAIAADPSNHSLLLNI